MEKYTVAMLNYVLSEFDFHWTAAFDLVNEVSAMRDPLDVADFISEFIAGCLAESKSEMEALDSSIRKELYSIYS